MKLELTVREIEGEKNLVIDENGRTWKVVGTKGEVEIQENNLKIIAGRTDGEVITLRSWTSISRYMAS